jgi:hypothetical protein
MLRAFTVGYLATLREDGAPRIHPVTVTLHEGGLFVFVLANSRRAQDLVRDERYALHAWPHAWTGAAWDDEEFEIEGVALQITVDRRRAELRAAHNDSTGPDDLLFELLIESAHWKSRSAGKQHIRRWPG